MEVPQRNKEPRKTLPRLVEDLLDASAYPSGIPPVEMVETHVSFIFFVGGFVYKVKKPVDYGFLDFTTLDKRRYFCEQEVELNRRLSPDVYIGVEEIRRKGGQHRVGGPGRTVEYAVKMRRLPSHRSMDRLLRRGLVSVNDVEQVAAKIARFHHRADRGQDVTLHGDPETVRRNVEENFIQTSKFVGLSLSRDAYDELRAYSRAFMDARMDLFVERAEDGYIRDCHGDLHSAHVFLETPAAEEGYDGISIIDCIEFNERFRCSDVTEDIAFLAMDIDYHGRPDLSRSFVDAYVRESRDQGLTNLLNFFKAYRAYVRGKVTSFRLDEPDLPEPARAEALKSAGAYFRLAHSYVPAFPRPSLIMVIGVTGTGKSTIALDLARRWSAAYVSSDVTRKRLTNVAPQEHRYEPFMKGIYSPRNSDLTYEAMAQEARRRLDEGESVIVDGTFRFRKDRERMLEAARQSGAETWIIECRLNEKEARRRLENRFERGDSLSDGRWELYHAQLEQWEPVNEVPSQRQVTVDTGGSKGETLRSLLEELYRALLQVDSDTSPASGLRSQGCNV